MCALPWPQLLATKVEPIFTTLCSFIIALEEHIHKSPTVAFAIKSKSTSNTYNLNFHYELSSFVALSKLKHALPVLNHC